jgi:septation ring formation regulator EzrA
MDNLADSIRRLHDQIQAKNQDMNDFKNKLSSLIASIQSVLQPLREKMERVAQLTSQISQLTEELASIKEENARLLEEVKETNIVKKQLQEAQQKEAELLGQIGTLTDNLNKEIDNLDQGQTPSVALADQIDALERLQQELQQGSSRPPSSGDGYRAPSEDLVDTGSNNLYGGWMPSMNGRLGNGKIRRSRYTRRRSTRSVPRRSITGKRLITF